MLGPRPTLLPDLLLERSDLSVSRPITSVSGFALIDRPSSTALRAEDPRKPAARVTSRWLARYVTVLVALDVAALLVGGVVGQLIRFQDLHAAVHGVNYDDLVAGTVPLWLLALAGARTYEGRYLGLGSDEFRRVGNAAAQFTALIAVLAYLSKWEIARGLVVVTLPLATALTLVFRYTARKVLHRLRRAGVAAQRVLLVGDGPALDVLAARLAGASYSGLIAVGTCRPPASPSTANDGARHVREHVLSLGADAVAVAHSPGLGPDVLRRIAWALEGTGVDLLVAPALTDVAGPRVNIRPVSGLPLLQVSEPEFGGARRLFKAVFDVVAAAGALAALSPVLVLIAVLVRTTSHGPVLFRQVRIGRDGHPFAMYKFRSMHLDAEARLEELRILNDHGDEVLFKMREDPRITPVGRRLRRYSLDELPQLLNVLRGQMSLVGPRPPLPAEVARYATDAHRRLLVKPGLTGLWQVSGRADLDWDETVRLDLYYVENWSPALDAQILWKTLWAVADGTGAR